MHKNLTFAVSERGHGRQPYPQYFGETNSQTRTHDLSLLVEGTCHSFSQNS